MKHPLVNPSLAPFGFVFPLQRGRLDYKPMMAGGINPERLMARCWTKANRKDAPHPRPIEEIVHRILPSQAAMHRHFDADFQFEGRTYRSRDVLVLSSIMQWLATNCGDCFLTSMPNVPNTSLRRKVPWWDKRSMISLNDLLEFHPRREFVLKLRFENASFSRMWKPDMVTFWTHECNEHCHTQFVSIFGEAHFYRQHPEHLRDRALAHGLMWWLGSPRGRAFIADYLARRKRMQASALARAMAQSRARFAARAA